MSLLVLICAYTSFNKGYKEGVTSGMNETVEELISAGLLLAYQKKDPTDKTKMVWDIASPDSTIKSCPECHFIAPESYDENEESENSID